MQNPNERIAYLVQVYAAKKATAAELNELMNRMQEAGEDAALKTVFLNEWAYYKQHPQERDHVNGDAMFTRILESGNVRAMRSRSKIIRFTTIAAAAAILLLLVTGAWFVFLKKEPAPKVATRTTASKDIKPPAANRATITLGNGQTVYLDQAQNGALAKQGNVQIIKLADGQVAYRGGAKEMVYNTLTNPRGSRVIQMTLADGTGVWLNAASSVTYPAAFTGHERNISISGEAYFEVAKDPKKKFIVNILPSTGGAGGGQVEVLGTHFNIKAYNDDDVVQTTLLEGKVKASVVNGQSAILKPGEQAQITTNHKLQTTNDIDIEEIMAWKNGMFRFNGANIKEIMRQAERWYNIQVVYEGDVAGLDFSGFVSRQENISGFLKIFEVTGLVHFSVEENKVIVKKQQ